MRQLLSATATLEFRLVDSNRDAQEAKQSGRVPVGDILLERRDGSPVLLKRRVILTGDYIIDATSGFDSVSSSPAVFITLDGRGANRMSEATKDLIGQSWAWFSSKEKSKPTWSTASQSKHARLSAR